MNAELVSGGQTRILIPIVYRDDYLTGLRVLTRQGGPEPLIRVLDFAHRCTAATSRLMALPSYAGGSTPPALFREVAIR
jgi:hypothetical protein